MTTKYCYWNVAFFRLDNYFAVVWRVIKLPFILSIIFNGLFAYLLMQSTKEETRSEFTVGKFFEEFSLNYKLLKFLTLY